MQPAELYVELVVGEQIVYQGRPSPRVSIGYFIRWGILAVIPAAIASYLWAHGDPTLISVVDWWCVSLVWMGLVIVRNAMRRRTMRYTVTTHRVMVRRGIMGRTEHSTAIARIHNITVRQSLWQRILGIGDIEFDTSGVDLTEANFAFAGVAHPRQIADRLRYTPHEAGAHLWDERPLM
jgi:uncharacterized membrane protein YdbT with pleckstrin-like domain